MEASEVWVAVMQAGASAVLSGERSIDRAATAVITQALAIAITEDRRGRTFTVRELDKARAEGIAEGREEAAVICESRMGAGNSHSRAIRAAKGAGDV